MPSGLMVGLRALNPGMLRFDSSEGSQGVNDERTYG